jgi:hypothetical protein
LNPNADIGGAVEYGKFLHLPITAPAVIELMTEGNTLYQFAHRFILIGIRKSIFLRNGVNLKQIILHLF